LNERYLAHQYSHYFGNIVARSTAIMAPYQLSCHQIALLLADKITPNLNLEDHLLAVTNDKCNARVPFCLILRTQLTLEPEEEHGTFFHDCWSCGEYEQHAPFAEALVCANHSRKASTTLPNRLYRSPDRSIPRGEL
jgi:hypothetical protein